MSHRSMALSLLVSLVLLGSAAVARAEGAEEAAPQIPKPASAFPWFAAVGAGVSYPTIAGSEIAGGGALAPTFTLHGGYTFGDHLNVGLEFTSTETKVGRDSGAEQFRVGYSPQAECTTCTAPVAGADVIATSLVFSTIGSRAEYSPFGRDGLFIGGTAGLAFLVGLAPQTGFGFGGRIGYRLRATNVLAISLEGGMQGQIYGDTTMYMPYGAAVLRPSF